MALAMSFSVAAQKTPLAPDVAPASPNAASLGQYGEIPVDLYHGLPSISVPLYTIQVDDVQVPISLSFHASGHKVGTIASWVGLGWSLNAGGVVTRSMRGQPDESPNQNGFASTMALVEAWEADPTINLNDLSFVDNDSSAGMKHDMWQIHQNNWDTQADIFFYNYPGGSGKFMFKPDGSIIQFPYQDLKIIGDINGMGGFTIKTPNGMVAGFGAAEYSTANFQSGTDIRHYPSAWYLSSYKSVISDKSVNFRYDNGHSIQADVIPTMVINERHVENPPDYSYTPSFVENYSHHQARYLESITWESGKAVFYSSATRADQANAHKLDSIAIFNSANERMKSFHLGYRPFTSQSAMHQALVLESVTEVGRDGATNPPYLFEYHGISEIPARDSKARDHFGYHNGVPNTTLIPEFLNMDNAAARSDADRNVKKDEAIVGTIAKITYPTGGYSTFTFESNDYYSTEPGSSANIRTSGTAATAESCSDMNFLYFDSDGNGILGLQCLEQVESTPLTIREDAYDAELTISRDHAETTVIEHGAGNIFIADLIEVDGANETVIASYTGFNGTDQTITNLLEPGKTYKVRSHTNILGTRLRTAISYKYIDTSQGDHAYNFLGPGIRIKRIDHHDGAGIVNSKVYEYRLQEDSTKSSGMLLARHPTYHTYKNALEYIPSTIPDDFYCHRE